MKNARAKIRSAFAAAMLLAMAGDAVAGCLSPGQAQQYVASGAIMRLGTVAAAVGGEVVDAKLCQVGGMLVYKLSVMRDGGRIDNMVIDATSGQQLR